MMNAVGRDRFEFFGAIVLSVLLYKLSPVFFLFIIPLLWVFFSRGETWFLYSSVLTIAGIFILSAVFMGQVESDIRFYLILIETTLPALLLTGTWIMLSKYISVDGKKMKSIIGIAVVGLISIPVIYVIGTSAKLADFVSEQVTILLKTMEMEQLIEGDMIEAGSVLTFFTDIALKNYLASLYIIMTGTYYLTVKVYSRFKDYKSISLRTFRLRDEFVWFLIAGWAGIGLSYFIETGILKYLFWNTGIIFLYLYGVQGLGIILYLLDAYTLSKGTRFAIIAAVIFSFLTPGLNLVLILGIPVFGVTELWIKYRERSKGHENHIE